jgi:tetratricopeptide (TPR) repeat protein
MHQQALALFREAKDRLGIAGGLLNLGKVAQHRNDAAHAARCYSEALATWKGSGFRQGVAEAFEALGTAAVDARQEKRGARLLGAAEALRESIGAVIPLVDRIDYDRAVAAVRAALGDTTESTWAEGRAMSLDQAVEYVLRGRP